MLFHTRNFQDPVYEMNQFLYGRIGVLLAGALWYSSSSVRRKRAKPVHRPTK